MEPSTNLWRRQFQLRLLVYMLRYTHKNSKWPGWTEVLTEAEIATSSTVDSFLKSSNITRTRHVHQIIALTLSKLQRNAFLCENAGLPDEEKFERWHATMTETSPTFEYWDMVLRIEI